MLNKILNDKPKNSHFMYFIRNDEAQPISFYDEIAPYTGIHYHGSFIPPEIESSVFKVSHSKYNRMESISDFINWLSQPKAKKAFEEFMEKENLTKNDFKFAMIKYQDPIIEEKEIDLDCFI